MASFEQLVFEIIAKDKNASAAFDRFRRSVDNTSGSLDKNTSSLQKNQKAQVSVLGGFVGLGVSLSAMATPLAAAGTGFVAFSALAVPSVKKITTAMTGPGGLAAAWGTLDKQQRNAAVGIQQISQRYAGLAKALEPQVFQVFNEGLSLANSLLGPTSRLATAAGHGLSSFLTQFTNDSGIQQFISFLSHEAAPALRLLGTDVTNIAHAVFNLLEAFGGLGLAELRVFTTVLTGVTDAITFLAQHAPGITAVGVAIGGLALALAKFGLLSSVLRLTGLTAAVQQVALITTEVKGLTIAERGLAASEAAVRAISPFGWALLGAAAIGTLVYVLDKADKSEQQLISTTLKLNQAQGFNTAGYTAAAQAIGHVTDSMKEQFLATEKGRGAVNGLGTSYQDLLKEQAALNAGAQQQTRFLDVLETSYGLTSEQAAKLASSAGVLVDKQGKLKDGFAQSVQQVKAYADANLSARGPTNQLAADMQDFANATLTATDRTTALTNALKLFFNPAVTADQDVIALKNDQTALAKALDASGGKTGLLTQKQRDARSAFDTYIGQVATAATDTFNATGKTSDYSRIINASLPFLERAAGHNKALRAEIQKLIDTEKAIRTEHVNITVSGSGSWSVKSINIGGGNRLHSAAGAFISGGTPGVDSVPIMAMPGEVVVPTRMVQSGAVDHLRGSIPGFASGGVVGHYGGGLGGMSPWVRQEHAATVKAIENATASAVFAALRAGPVGGVSGSVASWAPAVRQVLGMLGLPFGDAPTILSQMATESGGNPTIVNKWDSNWLAGHPSVGLMQVIAGTFGSYAGPYRNTGPFEYGVSVDPLANIYAGVNYAIHRYGNPGVLSVLGHGHGYDSGGWLPPGLSMAYNGTGRPERVLPHGGGSGGRVVLEVRTAGAPMDQLLAELIRKYVRVAGGGDVQVAFGTDH